MYQDATFLGFSKKYGMDVTLEAIHDFRTQFTLTKKMFDDDLGYHWKNCNNSVTKKWGSYKEATDT